MGPKAESPQSGQLFGYPLMAHLNPRHPLLHLAQLIDWHEINEAVSTHFPSTRGRPAIRPRLIVGLLYLQHTYNLSDEEVVFTWVENPYWQVFTGETYLQTEPPIDPSSLTRWRKRLGKEGLELLLSHSIKAAHRAGVVKASSLNRVIADTTVMEKAISYPVDSKLLERTRLHLVKAAQQCHLKLRQNYNREAPRLAAQVGRYAHAKQFKRMKSALRSLHSRVGRVYRDIERQLDKVPPQQQAKLTELLRLSKRILTQKRQDKNKLYALHAPEVECISKGKSRAPYEFGVKVSIVTTHKEGLVIGMSTMPGNPYDGHTLSPALEQVHTLTEVKPKRVIVDKGYKGVDIDGVQIWRSGQKRGVTRALKAIIKRRSAIEAAIGHMKSDGKLGINWLKGAMGDAIHALLCGAGHNIRMILRKLRLFCLLFLQIGLPLTKAPFIQCLAKT
jgi:IS5 family transposase